MQKKIIMYTTHTCPFCRQQKEWLDSNQVAYTNYFVDDDAHKAEEMIAVSGQMGVPFTRIIDGDKEHHVLGFQKEKLAEILGISSEPSVK